MEEIGRYKIIRKIGDGGMGTVYLALDPRIHRKVAIKLFRLEKLQKDKEALKRFYLEAEAIGKLSHPNIVTIYDINDEKDAPYMVMEYLEGETLSTIIKEKKLLQISIILDIAIQLSDALEYAHSMGIIHRDIKPANIIMLPNNKVKLTDFGIAKFQSLTASPQLTTTGVIVGTPSYMSPEQISGQSIDQRSDIFSLAVVIWELLAGRKAFDADSIATIAFKVVYEELPPPEKYNPRVPHEFSKILSKALQKKPEKRYPTVSEFKADLQNLKIADSTLSVKPYYSYTEKILFRLSNPIIIALIIFTAIIFSIAGFYFLNQKIPQQQKPIAQTSIPTADEFIESAKKLANNNKYNEAILKLNQALRNYPKNIKIKKMIAEMYFKSQDYNAAILLYTDIASKNPNEINNILEIAKKWISNNKKEEAINLAKALQKISPSSIEVNEFLSKIEEKNEEKQTGAKAIPKEPIRLPSKPARAAKTNIEQQFPKVSINGKVTIISNPWAYAYINKVKIGPTPIISYSLPVGRHIIKLETPNGDTYEKTIFVFQNQTTEVYYNFESYAKIFVQSNKIADVYIDNQLVGKSPYYNDKMKPGKHIITIKTENHQETKYVLLKAGTRQDVQFIIP